MVKHNILHSPISLYYRALHKLQYKLRCFDLAANLSSRTVAFSNTLSPTTYLVDPPIVVLCYVIKFVLTRKCKE